MRATKMLGAAAVLSMSGLLACGGSTPAPTGPTTPAVFAVTAVAATASPAVSGCHRTLFNFAGSITASAAGNVSYRWVGSDGGMTAVETISFEGPGTKLVATSWDLGAPGTHWQAVRVLAPNAVESNRATITIACP